MRHCPDCARGLVPIQVLPPLAYAAAEAKPSWVDGRMAIAGMIRAAMCPACGRVLFHADLPRGSLPIPAETGGGAERGDLPLPAERGDA